MSIEVLVDLTGSPHVVLSLNESIELFKCLETETGGSRDLLESLRIAESFDEYLRYLKKKFGEYITPQKDHREVLLGRTIVHKIKLFIRNGIKFIEIVFDRRFDIEHVKKCLKNLGYGNIKIRRQML
ncbi:MAG: hypothetical protein DRO13_03265 [Thermoprotei archaeon]|nr:MAG: hypothetical protein DRO13_03265 [Thermoprotei archaeon]